MSPDVYIVEKVVNCRTRHGKLEYFLKWKGFKDDENTWEPAENLGCFDLIKEYKNEQTKTKVEGDKNALSSISDIQRIYHKMNQKKPEKKVEPKKTCIEIVHGASLIKGEKRLMN